MEPSNALRKRALIDFLKNQENTKELKINNKRINSKNIRKHEAPYIFTFEQYTFLVLTKAESYDVAKEYLSTNAKKMRTNFFIQALLKHFLKNANQEFQAIAEIHNESWDDFLSELTRITQQLITQSNSDSLALMMRHLNKEYNIFTYVTTNQNKGSIIAIDKKETITQTTIKDQTQLFYIYRTT